MFEIRKPSGAKPVPPIRPATAHELAVYKKATSIANKDPGIMTKKEFCFDPDTSSPNTGFLFMRHD